MTPGQHRVAAVGAVASALVLVRSAYDARRLFAEIHKADARRRCAWRASTSAWKPSVQLQATSLRVDTHRAREAEAMTHRSTRPSPCTWSRRPNARRTPR
jgi:cell division protein FtsL